MGIHAFLFGILGLYKIRQLPRLTPKVLKPKPQTDQNQQGIVPTLNPEPTCLEGQGDSVSVLVTPISHMSCSLNSLKGGYIGEYIVDLLGSPLTLQVDCVAQNLMTSSDLTPNGVFYGR